MRPASPAATGSTTRPSRPRCANSTASTPRCSPPAQRGLLSKLFGKRDQDAVRGLYLWGGVGRGKTFLIDLFFDALPIAAQAPHPLPPLHARGARAAARARRRTRPAQLRSRSEWRRQLRVLVLDEFFVSDIGDAMLLGRLLERLFAEGVALVTSSNTAPQAAVPGRPAARALPAGDRADRAALRRRPPRQPARLPPARADQVAGLPRAARRAVGRLAGRALGRAQPRQPARGTARSWSTAATSRCAAWPKATPGSTSPRCAKARARPPTTSRLAREFHTVLLGGIPRFDAHQRRRGAALRAPGRRVLRPPRQPGLHRRRRAARAVRRRTPARTRSSAPPRA